MAGSLFSSGLPPSFHPTRGRDRTRWEQEPHSQSNSPRYGAGRHAHRLLLKGPPRCAPRPVNLGRHGGTPSETQGWAPHPDLCAQGQFVESRPRGLEFTASLSSVWLASSCAALGQVTASPATVPGALQQRGHVFSDVPGASGCLSPRGAPGSPQRFGLCAEMKRLLLGRCLTNTWEELLWGADPVLRFP